MKAEVPRQIDRKTPKGTNHETPTYPPRRLLTPYLYVGTS